jgi:hypothetical protein
MSVKPDGHPSFGKYAGQKPTATQRKLQEGSGPMLKRDPDKKVTPKGSADQPGPADGSKKQLPGGPRKG